MRVLIILLIPGVLAAILECVAHKKISQGSIIGEVSQRMLNIMSSDATDVNIGKASVFRKPVKS